MEEGISNRKNETELMISKPRLSEVEKHESKELDLSVDTKSEQEIKIKEKNETSQGIDQSLESGDKIPPSALPPPEMFEIRNSPPLPFAGNKKLKKLIEKNKK